ncbi:MAG TPA: hypothetical protein VLI90_14790 [Tepidisphaeraceae bacterium]|nr:hypothetical protein [Tepidisphaeraceae bacterium]
MRSWALALILLAFQATPAVAQESGASTTLPADVRPADADADTHPVVSTDATWAGSVVILIGVMFVSAMVIGPIVRAEMTTDVPVAFSHDEDPSHHAGGHGGHH